MATAGTFMDTREVALRARDAARQRARINFDRMVAIAAQQRAASDGDPRAEGRYREALHAAQRVKERELAEAERRYWSTLSFMGHNSPSLPRTLSSTLTGVGTALVGGAVVPVVGLALGVVGQLIEPTTPALQRYSKITDGVVDGAAALLGRLLLGGKG